MGLYALSVCGAAIYNHVLNLMTLAGVDTSRLMGWSFIALLLSVKNIYAENSSIPRPFSHVIFLVNIFIPSLYVGFTCGEFPWVIQSIDAVYIKFILVIQFIIDFLAGRTMKLNE